MANDHDGCRKALSQFAEVEVFSIPQKHSGSRYVWDHLRSVSCGSVYTAYLYESRDFRRRLQQLLQCTRFDLVHVDSLDLASYLQLVGDIPTWPPCSITSPLTDQSPFGGSERVAQYAAAVPRGCGLGQVGHPQVCHREVELGDVDDFRRRPDQRSRS